jgi:DNA-binding winged helix-turn-helix (wHTH) protein
MRFLFANHVLDTDRRELTSGSASVSIGPQVFDLLVYLMTHRAGVVSKDELLENVWRGRTVLNQR